MCVGFFFLVLRPFFHLPLSFKRVNIDVNYLVSKQIRCMQSHRNCNWIANKIKLLFDDIVVQYTQTLKNGAICHFLCMQRKRRKFFFTRTQKFAIVAWFSIEMDCNKHATNVDNLTAWKRSKDCFFKCKNTLLPIA